jgi:hypothetical protein
MTAEHIVRVLGGRWTGRSGIARCPVHEDRSPSLSVSERDGRVLVHCHAGCPQPDVIAALRARGLWPERDRIPLSRADRTRLAREYEEARRIRQAAAYFANAATLISEWVLEELSPVDPERAVHTAILTALRVSPETEYRAWLARDPVWAAALVHAGRERAKRIQTALASWIVAEIARAS